MIVFMLDGWCVITPYCLQGANDSLLNVDGLTCYEGLSKEYLKEPGDPDSDEENDETAQMLEWK